ncbi:MAG: hypothetical protein NTW21_04885, partial [Verrucomicrobia bacterium]|nr:hypothetical protein [Verrucomicrobiota bacterium]
TYDNKSSASQGAGASIAWSHPVGTGADRMLVVGIATESTANVTVTGVSFGVTSPQAFTQVTGARAVNGTSTYNATDLWYLVAPAGTTDTITVTFSGSVTNGTVATAVSLFGVVQGAPEAVANFNAGAPPYSATISTALTDGAWLVVVGRQFQHVANLPNFHHDHRDHIRHAVQRRPERHLHGHD